MREELPGGGGTGGGTLTVGVGRLLRSSAVAGESVSLEKRRAGAHSRDAKSQDFALLGLLLTI